MGPDSLAIADRDPGSFLAAMLEGEQSKEAQFRDPFGAGYPNHTAFFSRSIIAHVSGGGIL
jgi:hypothetical protein